MKATTSRSKSRTCRTMATNPRRYAPSERGLASVAFMRLGLPADEYSLIGPPTHLYRHYALDAAGISAAVERLLDAGTHG
jgi:hypothetical protein